MNYRFVFDFDPELFMRDLAECFVRGTYTFDDYLTVMEEVATQASKEAQQ